MVCLGVEDENKVKDYLSLKLYAHGFSFRSRPLIAISPEIIVLSIGTIETKFRVEESDTAVQEIPLNWKASVCQLKALFVDYNRTDHDTLSLTVDTIMSRTNQNL